MISYEAVGQSWGYFDAEDFKSEGTIEIRGFSFLFNGQTNGVISWTFAFIHDNGTEIFKCPKVEGLVKTYNGGMDGETGGIDRDGKIDSLDERKHFGKLYFCLEAIIGLFVRN